MAATPQYEILALRYARMDERFHFNNFILPIDDHNSRDPLDFLGGHAISHALFQKTAEEAIVFPLRAFRSIGDRFPQRR